MNIAHLVYIDWGPQTMAKLLQIASITMLYDTHDHRFPENPATYIGGHIGLVVSSHLKNRRLGCYHQG